MKTRTGLVLAATVVALGAARGDAPLDTSADCTFALDSMGSPRAVKTAADIAALPPAVYRDGDTVAAIAPNGDSTISTYASDSTNALSFGAGGLWTFVNTPQGTATFTVRHSLYDTLGDGTAASPAKLVDGEELVDYNAGDGYVFTLEGGDTLLGALRLPAGFKLEDAGGGAWRIVSSSDGCLYEWARLAWSVDTKQAGPDRKAPKKEVPAVAYSGDDWARDASAASTLTLLSPDGITTTQTLTGTGTREFALDTAGDWTLTLEMADGRTMTSVVTVTDYPFVLVVR